MSDKNFSNIFIFVLVLDCYVIGCSVGRKLFTKRAGVETEPSGINDAEDITDIYKFKEGTDEERMAVLNAARGMAIELWIFDG